MVFQILLVSKQVGKGWQRQNCHAKLKTFYSKHQCVFEERKMYVRINANWYCNIETRLHRVLINYFIYHNVSSATSMVLNGLKSQRVRNVEVNKLTYKYKNKSSFVIKMCENRETQINILDYCCTLSCTHIFFVGFFFF